MEERVERHVEWAMKGALLHHTHGKARPHYGLLPFELSPRESCSHPSNPVEAQVDLPHRCNPHVPRKKTLQ